MDGSKNYAPEDYSPISRRHEWWNAHPLFPSQHQGGVHGNGSTLKTLPISFPPKERRESLLQTK
jgi:hypothetical protein